MEEGAPQIPALAFCFAISAIVTFCVGVPVFFGPLPASSDANASPPEAFGAAELGLLPCEERTPGVPLVDEAVGCEAIGTDVK